MSVVSLFDRARAKQKSGAVSSTIEAHGEHDENDTMLVMFSESEHLTLGLLINRRDEDDIHVFKDCRLEANRKAVSLSLRLHADDPPYMAIDKKRLSHQKGYVYCLREEERPAVTSYNLQEIYQHARDRVSLMLGEPLYDEPETVPSSAENAISLR